MRFEIIPLVGTDSIKFGMTGEEVQSILKIKPILFRESVVDLYDSEDYIICKVYYEKSANGNIVCSAISFNDQADVYIDGYKIMNLEASKAEEFMKRCFNDTKASFDNEFVTELESESNELFVRAMTLLSSESVKRVGSVYLCSKGFSKRRSDFLETNYTPENIAKIKDSFKAVLNKKIEDAGETFKKIYQMIKFEPSSHEYTYEYSEQDYQSIVDSLKHCIKDISVESVKVEHEKNYKNYVDLKIPIGASRIGGPIVDLPDDIPYPEGMFFVAQLNCSEIKQYDFLELLPESGFIYVFTTENGEDGVVYYSSKNPSELSRVIKKHQRHFSVGRLIQSIYKDNETLADSLIIEEDGVYWDSFHASQITKIYGAYTNCQKNEEEIISQIEENEKNDTMILIQIGSDFCGAGLQSVLIKKEDLKALNFSNCKFEYSCD